VRGVALEGASGGAMRIGIDFGTTRTVVAAADRGNYPVVVFETPWGEASDCFPSIAAARRGALAFGFEAALRIEQGWSPLRSMKSLLSANRPVAVGDTEVSAMELVRGYAEALQAALRNSNLGADAAATALAVPANAKSGQRFLTLEGFRRAGFEVVGMLGEPAAAGVEFAHRYARTLRGARQRVLVYDLGGGTFDASIVDMGDSRHEVLRSAGARIGGDDFDRLLAERVGAIDAALLERCRVEKERIHANTRRVVVDGVTVPIDEYYEACAPLVERTLAITESIVGDDDDIAGVYVVGGASALPIVARRLRERFGRRVHRTLYPSGATAIGLAIAFDPEAGLEVDERHSRAFGVFRERAGGDEVAFDPIFEGPVSGPCVRRYRAAHNIGHFRFLECDRVEDGTPTGELNPSGELLFAFAPELVGRDLSRIPVVRTEPGPEVEERYTVDRDGFVAVEILCAGHRAALRLGAHPGA